MLFGIILVIIGVVFLLEATGLISGNAWQIIWPCLIIVLGLGIMCGGDRRCFRSQKEDKAGHSDKK